MKEEPKVIEAEVVEETSQTGRSGNNPLLDKLLSPEHWLRFVFMCLFVCVAFVASYVMLVLVIIQFIFALVLGNSETRLRSFGSSLSQYIFQSLNFLTYNTEDKPFPFADWPEAETADGVDAEDTATDTEEAPSA